jgi:Methylase involved in ubiquinone/menaquinone biosynthesis
MIDTSSNEYWINAANYQSFEMRSHRFRAEMLPVFYQWLGITPDSNVLDGGCGSGVFTRYLAAGLVNGHITGFDINKTFIEYAKSQTSDKTTFDIADGYNLRYSDETFDAVTNYTYTGTLSDPEAGIKELIRVCKSSGTVSCVIATTAIPYVSWSGNYPFDKTGELQKLSALENKIFAELHKPHSLQCRELILFKKLGLSNIHMYPFSHLICYSDDTFPLDYRKKLALEETREEIDWLNSRYSDNKIFYESHGFSRKQYLRLTVLLEQKYTYLSEHFETCESYEWHGGFNYIVTGIK